MELDLNLRVRVHELEKHLTDQVASEHEQGHMTPVMGCMKRSLGFTEQTCLTLSRCIHNPHPHFSPLTHPPLPQPTHPPLP